MVPDNMYVIHHSLEHTLKREEDPNLFHNEKWYNKDFYVRVLTDDEKKYLLMAKNQF